MNAYAAARQPGRLQVLAVTTAYASLALEETLEHLPVQVRDAFVRCMAEQADHYGPQYYACYYRTRDGNESLLYMSFSEPVEDAERELLGLFSANVAITYERLLEREELVATQDAIIHILGEALESRSAASGGHVERVGEIAAMLGAAVDMPDSVVRQLRQAAPLHDIGHAGIPDEILNLPGPLDAAQRTRMQAHSDIGWHMLSSSKQPVLQLAAHIAHEHHERWDGAGYPRGLQGGDISLAARITALADFVDAMVSPRSYRPAHSLQHALEEVREGSGSRFDPALANLLLQHQDELRDLYRRHPPH
jgi:HD-GYP domain-containing protein (c-di-GMP phosphodiesterase class II)